MEKPNLQSQGMLKMLQDLYGLLKAQRQQTANVIYDRVGMDFIYWKKLRDADIVINLSKAPSKPVYKWNTIEPNIYMALETLRDFPNYGNPKIKETDQLIEEYEKTNTLHRCLNCGQIFSPERITGRYCSDKCRVYYNRKTENNQDASTKEVSIPQKNTIPPKHEWVRDYCDKRKNGIDPVNFINYYTRNEWKVKISGKMQPMLNWQSAIHTWEANQKRPVQINQVANIKTIPLNQLVDELELRGFTGIGIGWITDDKLLAELKKRGYKGDISKKILF